MKTKVFNWISVINEERFHVVSENGANEAFLYPITVVKASGEPYNRSGIFYQLNICKVDKEDNDKMFVLDAKTKEQAFELANEILSKKNF